MKSRVLSGSSCLHTCTTCALYSPRGDGIVHACVSVLAATREGNGWHILLWDKLHQRRGENAVRTNLVNQLFQLSVSVFYFILHEKGLGRAKMLCHALSRIKVKHVLRWSCTHTTHYFSFYSCIWSGSITRYIWFETSSWFLVMFVILCYHVFVVLCCEELVVV